MIPFLECMRIANCLVFGILTPSFQPSSFTIQPVQGKVLSPPFANLTIAPILHHPSPVRSTSCNADCPLEHDHLFFADDVSILVASKSFDANITLLASLFIAFAKSLLLIGIVVEFDKTDLIHFYRKHNVPSPLPSLVATDPFTNISHTLTPKPFIRSLGFYLDTCFLLLQL